MVPATAVSNQARDLDDTTQFVFPPHVLRDYAFLADGERGILVGPHGDFAWMCAPSWHDGAVFSALVGGGGVYAVTPRDARYVWGGYYEEDTLIWHSRWATTTGIVECREALAFPGDPHLAVVLRRVIATDTAARVLTVLDARADFGRKGLRHLECRDGVWTGRSGPLYVRWSGAGGATVRRDGVLAQYLDVQPGDHYDLVLEISDRRLGDQPPAAGPTWEATEAAWTSAVPDLGETRARRDSGHAYAVLRGLTSCSGGMVAAATTSLPERAEAGNDYDYRYVWIRDQCYAGQAAAVNRALPLLDDAVRFVTERILADGPELRPAYRVDGGQVPDERRLRHLSGYPGGADRVGNRVNRQFQLDAVGETLLLFAAASRHQHLDREHWRAVEIAVETIKSRWGGADAGIWELDNQHWAHSRLTCVAGLRAASRHASPGQGADWQGLADAILADVSADCVHPTGRWQRSPVDDRVDAALLFPAVRGALPPDDPRSIATLEAVRLDLAEDGYVYRFRHDERPLGEAEGAFLLCGFLMALASHQQHCPTDAVAWFERNRSSCGPPGLFTEEFDITQRQLRGNVPQAFAHALLLESAARLAGSPGGP